MRHISLIIALLCVGLPLWAQPGKIIETVQENLDNGDALMLAGSYYNAAEYYLKAAKMQGNKDAGVLYKAAEAYRLGRDYKRAAGYYERAKKRFERDGGGEAYPLLEFWRGSVLQQAGDYEAAEEAFFIFQQSYTTKDAFAGLAELRSRQCQWARKQQPAKLGITQIDKLSSKVNSKYTEFAPMPLGEGELLFASLKSDVLIMQDKQSDYARFYKASIQDFDRVRSVSAFDKAFDMGAQHVGNGSLSADGERFYFTVCAQGPDLATDCKIYLSEKKANGNFNTPQPLGEPLNLEGYASTTPFVLSEGGEDLIFFSSERPGSKGGKDLWVCSRSASGTLGPAKNLGEAVNSIGDEIAPFIDRAEGYDDPRMRLYFSSTGHMGYGGMDVQRSYLTGDFIDWTGTENLGPQVNSPADDMYFIMDASKLKAFMVSNREGGYGIDSRTCCDDIYVAALEPPVLEKIIVADLEVRVLQGKVPTGGATLRLYDLSKGRSLLSEENSTEAGEALRFEELPLERDYELVMEKAGFESQSFSFSTKGLTDSKTFKKDFILQQAGLAFVGKSFGDRGKDGRQPLPGSKIDVYKVQPGQPDALVSSLQSGPDGSFKTVLEPGFQYKITGSKDGYLTTSINVDARNVTRMEERQGELVLRVKEQNVAFKIENILYDFDSANLRPESIASLTELRNLLRENPSILIEIGSHTDNKGSDTYNQQLSERRAQSVVDWLVSNGIERSRLSAKGYGESQPLLPNTNPDGSDNPDNRQLNRRTEFKIVGDRGN